MDFAASLIGVAGLAATIISRCRRYLTAVKDCPSDLRSILVETSSLKSVIEDLEFLYQNSPDSELKLFFQRLDGDGGPICGSRDCLEKLEKLLPEDLIHSGNGKKRRSLQPSLAQLAWPFHESKAKKLLGELGRFRSSIALALTTDISYVEPA
jgi:hypothetical protein